jgi:hypothetical protein
MINLIKFTKFKHKQICLSFINNSYNKVSFIHISAIVFSDNENFYMGRTDSREDIIELATEGASEAAVTETPTEIDESSSVVLRQPRSSENLSELNQITHKKKEDIEEEDVKEIMGSNYNENFPWFIDDKGQTINFNQPITLFDSIKLISNFLEKRYLIDKDFISEIKITKLLEIFKDDKNVTVLELYNHVANLYNQDKNSLIKDLIPEKEKLLTLENTPDSNIFKPFGKYGDKTLNELGVDLLKLNWSVITDSAKITIHAVPLTINFISFSILLKGYMKLVHNRPYDKSLNTAQLGLQQAIRRRNLALFSLFGAPLILYGLRSSSIGLKNMVDINLESDINKTNNSGLFLLLSKINNKIPNGVKLFFKLLFFTILVLKLLGYSFIYLNNIYFLKNFLYFTSFLMIIYQFFNLYLLHKFSIKNVKISKILPDFIINWLKEFEIICSSKSSVKEFKKTCYIEILIYIIIMVIITIL